MPRSKPRSYEPIKPNEKQIKNAIRAGWIYDPESFLFERGDEIGCYTIDGFIRL